jgi:GAF domain-containing protein
VKRRTLPAEAPPKQEILTIYGGYRGQIWQLLPPKTEAARVAALQKYAILDTEPEQAFDDLVLLASFICNTPIALISLVDENRQWFKSKVGISISETPREISFCAAAIQQPDVFVVPDTLEDERFRNNSNGRIGTKVRFYAGAPLIKRGRPCAGNDLCESTGPHVSWTQITRRH